MSKKHPIKEKKNRKSVYISLFIAFIMITSAFGVIFYGYASDSQTIKYGNYRFKATPLGYQTKIDGKAYVFDILPSDIGDLNVSAEIKGLIGSSQGVLMTSDPSSSYKQEIALEEFNVDQVFTSIGKGTATGFAQESTTLPYIGCENSTSAAPVMYFQDANSTEAFVEGTCIRMNFDTSFNLKRLTAKIMYIALGVVDG